MNHISNAIIKSNGVKDTIREWNSNISVDLTESRKEYIVTNDNRVTDILFPRITDIIGIIDKYALRTWAMNTALDYVKANLFDNMKSVQTKSMSEILDETLEEASHAHEQKRDVAATFGSEAHDILSRIVETPNMTIASKFQTVVDNWKRWLTQSKLSICSTEQSLYYYDENENISFAGTADLIAMDQDGNIVIVDYKTGARLYPETCLQLAAYCSAFNFLFEDNFKDKKIRAIAIKLPKTEEDQMDIKEVANINFHQEMFMNAYKLKQWQSNRKKWVK